MAEPHYLLDSDVCIYLLQGRSPELTERVLAQRAGTLFLSSIALAEVAQGFRGDAPDAPELDALLRNVPVLAFDEAAARTYATLPVAPARLHRLIAAHAISLDMILVTIDAAAFADVPRLKTENWTQ